MGLPLSYVSTAARNGRYCSIRSAILLSTAARCATEVRPQASAAACAASTARSTSSACERAILQTTWPVVGDILSKYTPLTGATHFPPMKFSYRARSGILRSIVLRCAAKELLSLMGPLSCAELVGRTWALIRILLRLYWIQFASRATCRPAAADDASRYLTP